MNPFLRRATEYIRDTTAFLAITSPEPMKTFIANHRRVNDLFDFPVRIIGSPGTVRAAVQKSATVAAE